jgi:hypothetical protein
MEKLENSVCKACSTVFSNAKVVAQMFEEDGYIFECTSPQDCPLGSIVFGKRHAFGWEPCHVTAGRGVLTEHGNGMRVSDPDVYDFNSFILWQKPSPELGRHVVAQFIVAAAAGE